jgi:hypothetical protein
MVSVAMAPNSMKALRLTQFVQQHGGTASFSFGVASQFQHLDPNGLLADAAI